jgi:hypothetical protein
MVSTGFYKKNLFLVMTVLRPTCLNKLFEEKPFFTFSFPFENFLSLDVRKQPKEKQRNDDEDKEMLLD